MGRAVDAHTGRCEAYLMGGALRDRTGGTIGMSGSLMTLRSLLEVGLVDELDLLVDPVVVSGERRWTDGLERVPFEPVPSEALPTWVLHLVHRPAS